MFTLFLTLDLNIALQNGFYIPVLTDTSPTDPEFFFVDYFLFFYDAISEVFQFFDSTLYCVTKIHVKM